MKARAVEPGLISGEAKDLLTQAHAKITRHPDAGAAVAHCIVKALVLADVSQLVEGICDEAHP